MGVKFAERLTNCGGSGRNGFGLVSPARPLARKSSRVLHLRAARATVPATENPRVRGSIPPLATTPTSMNRKRFPTPPADHRRSPAHESADHRTSEYRVGYPRCAAPSRVGRAADRRTEILATWELARCRHRRSCRGHNDQQSPFLNYALDGGTCCYNCLLGITAFYSALPGGKARSTKGILGRPPRGHWTVLCEYAGFGTLCTPHQKDLLAPFVHPNRFRPRLVLGHRLEMLWRKVAYCSHSLGRTFLGQCPPTYDRRTPMTRPHFQEKQAQDP